MLPAEYRLRKQSDHQLVFKRGRRILTPYFVLIVYKRKVNKSAPTRFSIVVSKRVNPLAVRRNRIKRVLRETLKFSLSELKPGFDCVVIAKTAITDREISELIPVMREAFHEVNLFSI